MKKVYIAGPISSPDPAQHLNNMHAFFKAQDEIIRTGGAPFNPAADYLLGIMYGDYTYNMYFEPNLEWLKAADAVFVLPGYEHSRGAMVELGIARSLGKEIIYSSPVNNPLERG